MPTAVLERTITTDDLLSMPADGMDRWLIRGELREKPMTVRNRMHSSCTAWISYVINDWLVKQPKPRGRVYDGEAGVRLRGDPDTTVGVDVVYASAELATADPDHTTLLEGTPTLVVEVLSPSDDDEGVKEKIFEFLAAGVPHIWIVDTEFETIRVHQPGKKVRLYNTDDTISCEPEMPGFTLPVHRFFEG